MKRRESSRRRWAILGLAAFAAVLLAIWEHSEQAVLARRESQLQGEGARVQREVNFERERLAEIAARPALDASTDERLRPAPPARRPGAGPTGPLAERATPAAAPPARGSLR